MTEEVKDGMESAVEKTVVTTIASDSTDSVTAKLKSLGVADEFIGKIKDFGAKTVDHLALLKEGDLVGAGMPVLEARSLIATLMAKPAGEPAANTANAVSAVSFDSVLPAVPSDSSWLEALKAGGVLKVDQSSVISAVRAALAYKVGLYRIPDGIVDLMEQFDEENEEQADPEYFKLRKLLTRRNYAEIFQAIEGLDGTFVTEARKNRLFQRIDEFLWPSISGFFSQLKAWQEAWMQGVSNPGLMMSMFMAGQSGIGALPPGLMQPPDTGVLRDQAEDVANSINKVFAGTGVQVAAALAYDASKIKATIMNPRLPALTGCANRDAMLRKLGAAVSPTYPRLETNLTWFVLSVIQVKDQPAGIDEMKYFGALYMLGSQIPWDQLGDTVTATKRPPGIGGRRHNIREGD